MRVIDKHHKAAFNAHVHTKDVRMGCDRQALNRNPGEFFLDAVVKGAFHGARRLARSILKRSSKSSPTMAIEGFGFVVEGRTGSL